MPSVTEIKSLLDIGFAHTSVDVSINFSLIAEKLVGMSRRDIFEFCRTVTDTNLERLLEGDGSWEAIQSEENLVQSINQLDIEEALAKVKPSVSNTDLAMFENWLD